MIIQFERRTDRPDAAGRCTIHLRAYFEGQRLRFATRERCLASEWNTDKGRFRKPFPGFQDANDYLDALAERLQSQHRHLRTLNLPITPEALKAVLLPPVEAPKPVEAAPVMLTDLYTEYQAALQARGNLATSLVSVATTLAHFTGFEKVLRKPLRLADYDLALHDKFLGYLRLTRRLAPNSICKSVKHLKAFLRYAREDRKLALAVETKQLKVQWAEVEKVYLTVAELAQLEAVELPAALVATRDAFLFCCYTGLRHSDLQELSAANVQQWDGSRVLRLTQTKTRTAVSIYLTPPAAALLDKYEGQRARLLPAYTNQVMNRNLKQIAQLAGLKSPVEVVAVENGQVVKRAYPKHKLVTMHTARHTFAVQSLMRGLPVAVLQKVLGHAKIQTTMIYAKIVEDFQHREMRRVWEENGIRPAAGAAAGNGSNNICAMEMAA